jgi:photosystem II stability/assembly factor-like uncharacterized protein
VRGKFLLACVLISPVLAEGQANPPKFVDAMPDFNSVALSSDGKTVWVAAGNGLLYTSTDGGIHWNWTDVPGVAGPLLGLYFSKDRTRAWAVGVGRIAYSENGGETWREARSVPNVVLRRVVFDPPGKRGFAVGDVVLETQDGGISWSERADAAFKNEKEFEAVAFDPDWQHGLIGCPDGLLESLDGGRSWNKVQGKFRQITKVWASSDTAAALSRPGDSDQAETYWYWTKESGRWSEVWDAETNSLRAQFTHDVATLAGDHGIYQQVLRRHLQRVLEGEFRDVAFAPREIDATHTVPDSTGVAVGEGGVVARTEDAGQTWRIVHRWPDLGVLLRVAMQPQSERVWAVGEKIWRSDDEGRSFRQVSLPNVPMRGGFFEGVMGIEFSPDGHSGWMTTAGGAIVRSTDGGETWTRATIAPATNREIYRVRFAPGQLRGLGVGFEGIFLTEDGGASWKRIEDTPSAFDDIELTDQGRTVWAVGPVGRIFRSDDWCKTWKQIHTGTQAHMRGIRFRNEGRVGWAWGSAVVEPDFPPTILRTTDSGRSWKPAQINADGEVLSIRPVSFDSTGTYGFALADVDGERAILRSVDSGATWDEATETFSGAKTTISQEGHNVSERHQETLFTDLAMTEDGMHGWACGQHLLMMTAHQSTAPHITRFAVSSPGMHLDLDAHDPDAPATAVQGTIDVKGEGIPPDGLRQSFDLVAANTVSWPQDAFHTGEKYTFHLRLSDGWNIVTREYELVAGSSNEVERTSASPALEIPGLQGLDLESSELLLDGKRVPAAQVITRGSGGSMVLTPSTSALAALANGFHTLTVTRGSGDVLNRIGFYKEELTLKLFRPYARSYALLIAVGDYPAQSGYRKLPNAVAQAKDLEKALRSQGFTVLPPLYDRDATRARIEEAIRTAPVGPEDRLFVYFGGHGDDEEGFQQKPVGYLLPYDGRKSDLWGTAIPLDKFAGEYSSRLRAKHVLFALDSCQSGLALTRGDLPGLQAEELRRFKALADIEALSSEPGRTIMTAGSGGQDALDISGGIFTAALTDAIRGKADLDHNGVVDYFELFAYVWGRVNSEARQWTQKQQPADYHLGNGRWVFVYQ